MKLEKEIRDMQKKIEKNLTPEQIQAYKDYTKSMGRLSSRMQKQLENVREFLAVHGLLSEFEQAYGALEVLPPVETEPLSETEAKEEKEEELTPEQKEARQEEIRNSQKPLIL